MRVNRLDLIRYGRFENAEISFPKPVGAAPDVTIVFGANEAGKSTAFNGFLELLFGFAAGAHPYAFRFKRSDLLMGAELEIPERGNITFQRNSKRIQSLLDAEGRPLDEAILSSALHGMTKETYQERFSLDESGLREGGRRIAEAHGDLGQLLHAGISGLTGMAETLDLFTERANKFHKKGGRDTILKNGKNRLKEIREELRVTSLTSDRERNLRRSQEQSTATFDKADTNLGFVRQRQAACEAAQIWYDLSARMQKLENSLKDFPDGPELSSDAPEQVAGLVEKIAAKEQRIMELKEKAAKQSEIITDNPVDDLAQKLSAELERLDQLTIDGAQLMVRAASAQADLDRRKNKQQNLSNEIDDVLKNLQIPKTNASSAVLQVDALENLSSALQNCQNAQNSEDSTKALVETARAQRGDAPPKPKDLTMLRSAFDAWSAMADLSTLETECDNAQARLTNVRIGLPDTWKELIDAGLPAPETLTEVARGWAELTANLKTAAKTFDDSTAELAEARADVSEQESAPETVNLDLIEETRRQRDLSWQNHLGNLSKQTVDQFEKAMYADDGSRANYLFGAEARQRLAAAKSQLSKIKVQHEIALNRQSDLKSQYTDLSERCSKLAVFLGLASDTEPTAFSSQYQKLFSTAEADANHFNAQEALKTCITQNKATYEELCEAAKDLGLNPVYGELGVQAQRILMLEDSDRAAWDKWEASEKHLAELIGKMEQCGIDNKTAQNKLNQLTANSPLVNYTAEKILVALPNLRKLEQVYRAHLELSARIEAMEMAIISLNNGAQLLARVMDMAEDESTVDPVQVIDMARERVLASNESDKIRNAAIHDQNEAVAAKHNSEQELLIADEALKNVFNKQMGQDLQPRDRVVKLVERDHIRKVLKAAEEERLEARSGVDDILFGEELDLLPLATRAAELEQLLADAQIARDSARDTQREAERLYVEAFEVADNSGLVTEQATLREDLRSHARKAMVARLGSLAARGALRRLALERRSDMLCDVENAFVSMTAPAWAGIKVWSQTDGEKLVGVQPNGNSVPVEQMSTGTMGQLYFALRLAGYHSFSRAPGPLPMILDDIMETFDDTRSRAALKLCAEIGKNGQSILFTHHAHLVDLARDTIPGITIINMPE